MIGSQSNNIWVDSDTDEIKSMLSDSEVSLFHDGRSIEYTPGSDIDVDIITINTTGTPKFWWNESTNSFEMNKSLTIPGDSLRIGSHILSENITPDDDGFEIKGVLHLEKFDDGTAASLEIHGGTEPVAPAADHHRFWSDLSGKIYWQDNLGVSRLLHAAGGNAPGQWLLNGNDIYYNAGKVGIGTVTPSSKFEVNGVITAVNGNIAEIYNSAGMLKIQPDAQGDVEFFGDTDVLNSENGKILKVWRRAPEGNDYIRFYISSNQTGYIHTSCPLTLQAQVDFTINSVTEDIIFKVGDAAGNKKFYFKNSDGVAVATIDSNGKSYFAGNMGIGTDNPDYALHLNKTDEHSVLQVEANGENHGEANLFFKTQSDPGWQIFMDDSNLSVLGKADRLGFYHYGSAATRMVIDGSSGNVGIGTTNPGLPLEVRNADDNLAIFFDSRLQAQGVGGGIAFGGKFTDAGAEAMAGRIGTKKTNSTSGHVGFDMVFETQDSIGSITERMILTSDAKCGIHVPVFSSPTKPLDVWGDTRLRGNLAVDGFVGIGTNDPHDDLHIKTATPSFVFEDTDAPSNEKVWEWMASGGMLSLKTQNDNYTGSQTVISIDRGGTTPTQINFPNSKVAIGTTSLSGKLTVDQSSVSGGIPVLTLDQADVDEPWIEFLGGTVSGGMTGTNKYIKVKVENDIYYFRLFN